MSALNPKLNALKNVVLKWSLLIQEVNRTDYIEKRFVNEGERLISEILQVIK